MIKSVDTFNRLCNNSLIETNNRIINMSVNKFSVGDVAKVTMIESCSKYEIRLINHNWKHGWWFSKTDVSLVVDNTPLDNKLLTHQEVIQAIIDGSVTVFDAKVKEYRMINVDTLQSLKCGNFEYKVV